MHKFQFSPEVVVNKRREIAVEKNILNISYCPSNSINGFNNLLVDGGKRL